MNLFFRHIFFLLIVSVNISAQLVITEMQSANTTTLTDEFGESPDWIEIKNTSDSAINLNNWYLSDNTSIIAKWAFPEIIIKPNTYIVVLASGRDIKQQPLNWNTLVDLGNSWNYIIPSASLPANWLELDFDDSSWETGPSGIGYDNSDGNIDDSTIVPSGTRSVYMRNSFNVENVSLINTALFHMDYDDGFIAYLNGVEIARVNMGDAYSTVNYNDFACCNHEAVMSSGGMPDKFDISADINLLQSGENVLAVEVHNVSSTSSDLTAIPFLTIGQASVSVGKASPHLSLGDLFPHTNFKISSSGETIILSSPDSVIVDSLEAIISLVDVSYGIVSGTTNKKYFLNPTPGAINTSSGYFLLHNDSVRFGNQGGFVSSEVLLSMKSDGAESIYYTTDGSEPNNASNIYNQTITVNNTSTIRARIIKSGYLPGRVYSVSYIKGRHPDLPVVSLTTEEAYLWDDYIGMYADGLNASSSFPHFGANFWNDWERPFSFAYFNEEGNSIINQNIGAKIFGGWSRGQAQKSFSLFARKEYGSNRIDYPIFKDQIINSYSALVLRNSGNDWSSTMIRDGITTGITSHLNVEHQAFQPTVTYLNGEYWGIYNMREKVNEDFLASHHNLNPDDIIILQGEGDVVEGTNTEYNEFISYLGTNTTLVSTEKYNSVIEKIDVDNYIKYQLIQIYVGNTDWPGNNIKFWKTTDANSKWRWILYDTDFGFARFDNSVYHNTLSFALEPNGPGWPNPAWSTMLFRRMMTNIEFRNDFVNQMADNINTTFTSSNVSSYIDSLAGLIDSEMLYHTSRWGRSYSGWESDVAELKSFANTRPNVVRNDIRAYFNLSAKQNINLDVSDKEMGQIRINTITPNSYPFSGVYFEGVPITIEAIPKIGCKFVKWEGDNATSNRSLTINLDKTTSLKAIFEEYTNHSIELVINEINYNSSSEFNSGDWIELYNPTNSSFDISGLIFNELGGDSNYVFPEGTSIQPEAYLVLARNISKFNSIYPKVTNVIGNFPFGLSSAGDEIRLQNSNGEMLDAVDYLPYLPWPIDANGLGYTLELKNPSLDNAIGENWVISDVKGTPGRKNSNMTSILEDEIFSQENEVVVFPSKFSHFVTIQVKLSETTDINIEIVDLQGKIVYQIYEQGIPSDNYFVDWIPNERITKGVYFIKITQNNRVENSRVIYQ